MSWKAFFSKGMKHLREGDSESAITMFTKSLEAEPENLCIVYDARSSALEKLGRHKDSLKDVRKTIELAPEQFQGYYRAARLFLNTAKYPNALKMVEMAIERCPATNSSKRTEIISLKLRIEKAQAEHIRRTQNHSAILPIELFAEIVHILLEHESTSALRLSHVCTYWQTVITTNPLFWRTLVLGKFRPHIKAKLWISRSQNNIQELRVNSGALDKGWAGQGLELIDWSQLQRCFIEQWDFHGFLKQSGKLQELSSLQRYEFLSIEKLKPNQLGVLDKSWPLRHVTLHGTPLPTHFNELPPDVIQTLILRNSGDGTPVSLESHSSLETLVLENELRSITAYPPNLDKLQRLEITRISTFTGKLLDLSMPNLHILHLRNSPSDLSPALQTLLTQGTTQLTELVLSAVALVDTMPLLLLLRANKGLEKLELSRLSTGVASIVKSLICKGEAGCLESTQETICPNLQELNLSYSNDLRAPPLAQLVASRNSPKGAATMCAKIVGLVVDGCEEIDVSRLPWFRTIVPHFSCVYRRKNTMRQRR